uniref:Interleukin-1 n=1 Tax=Suricata suricatta TaxID=37032 RepID=A0A673SYJ6_SURSU
MREFSFHCALLPRNSVRGKQRSQFWGNCTGEKGRESVTTLPLRHSARLKVTTTRVSHFGNVRAFPFLRAGQGGNDLLWRQPAIPWGRGIAGCKPSEKLNVVPVEPGALFLGIQGGKLCLACVGSGDETRLQLEAVNITDLSKNKEQDKRFAFIRSDSGLITSFESAACPGWFLCTSLEADRPVSLTNMPKEDMMVTKFYFQPDR